MRVSTLLLFVSLFSMNVASAATPEDVLYHLQSALEIGDVRSFEMACNDGLLGRTRFSFNFLPSQRFLFATIGTSAIGDFMWTYTQLWTGAAGAKVTEEFQIIDLEIEESSAQRLVVKTKLAIGSSVVTQILDYDKSNRYIVVKDGSWLPRGMAICHLK